MERSRTTGLTSRNLEVHAAVCRILRKQGYPPSQQQIAQATKISPTRVRHHLDALVEAGYLKLDPGTIRGLQVLVWPEGIAKEALS